MSLDTILQLFGLYQTRQWAALASVVMLWLWHAASDNSRVPIPEKWRPVAIVILGETYATLQTTIGGMPVGHAIVQGLVVAFFTYGLGSMLFDDILDGKPLPTWLAKLLLLFPVPKPSPPPLPPPLPASSGSDLLGREAPTDPGRKKTP